MKNAAIALAASALTATVQAHATFQQLWIDGVDQGSVCTRLPASNSPVTDVTSTDLTCNAGYSSASSVCAIPAGSDITVEMHQQPNDRSCANEGIGGNHYGPVLVYMAKVTDAASDSPAPDTLSWFKIFESGYDPETDTWGNDVINLGCGKQPLTIPSDIAPGDYLLRAETIALHAAGGQGGAQFYMSCYQVEITGGGSASPSGVSLPGAYSATDPGILIDIYSPIEEYIIPGPEVYSG